MAAYSLVLLACLFAVMFCKQAIDEKIRAMLLLGGYGDILGSSTEDANSVFQGHITPPSEQSCALILTDSWYNNSMWPNTWKIWPPPEYLHRKVAVTDDTSQRMANLEAWLANVLQNNRHSHNSIREVLTEEHYVWWMQAKQKELFSKTVHLPQDWYIDSQRVMLADWGCMFQAGNAANATCLNGGHNTFYIKGAPTCFGLYMYLELGFIFSSQSPDQNYRFFRDLAHLDEAWAKQVTGFSGALVADAAGLQDTEIGFASWIHEKILDWIPKWNATSQDSREKQYLTNMYSNFTNLWQLGDSIGKQQAKTNQDFLEAFLVIYNNPQQTPQHPMKAHDPMTMMKLIVGSVAYANQKVGEKSQQFLPLVFQLVMAAPGDSDTTASFLGLISGAFYGEEAFSRFVCHGVPFSVQTKLVELSTSPLFHYDYSKAISLFSELSDLVSGPNH